MKDLAAKKHAIAVAGGREKLPGIRAALKGKWFNRLITDESVAEELIDESEICVRIQTQRDFLDPF